MWKTPDFRAAVRPDLFHTSVKKMRLKMIGNWHMTSEKDIRRMTHTHDLVALRYTRKFGRILLKDLTFKDMSNK